ncbi:MAG TPA: NAD-dependent deacylase [Oligoflexus sp.]|uniref:SIR2 family NAD-dependent protein deacylase n=1 Tax=Oligoflexus sp. TaxID=1971216 RepID=UPI002D802762|nr:NAD-dependent deacylase [Oligoflexus sp.]HET9241205.1 NAD-dependent deacylase [Oligoflexus sp.]
MKAGKIDEHSFIQKLGPDTRIVVLTGAGISAESGIPTFRDAQDGLWSQFRPEELASPEGFRANPKLVFDWYAWRRKKVLESKPNKGHEILALWGQQFPHMTLITQNVDGLHQAAGSQDLIEMHGSIHRLICFKERHPSPWVAAKDGVPLCMRCQSPLRPDVVWFGEMLDRRILEHIGKALANCEVFLAIGTSGLVYPAAGFLDEARASGALTVVINRERVGEDRCDLLLQGSASDILQRLQDSIQARHVFKVSSRAR